MRDRDTAAAPALVERMLRAGCLNALGCLSPTELSPAEFERRYRSKTMAA